MYYCTVPHLREERPNRRAVVDERGHRAEEVWVGVGGRRDDHHLGFSIKYIDGGVWRIVTTRFFR